jgi:phosphohistidine phosphatase
MIVQHPRSDIMQLYIVRHGYAGQHGDPDYPDDTIRPLTKKGRKQMRKVAKKLARRGFSPTIVVTSPLVRCRQTADAIRERLDAEPEVVELEALRPGGELEQVVNWSNEQQVEELAWVGHAPDVDQFANALLGAREGAVRFAKGAIMSIEFDGKIEAGRGRLAWLVTPSAIGC